MVVVVIVGILAAIAIPSYQDYVKRGARSAAQAELLAMASTQEKIFLNSDSYSANLKTAYTGASAGGLGKSTGLTADGKYNLDITQATKTFVMSATPVVSKGQVNDGCLLIQENGVRQWNKGDDAGCTSNPPVLSSPVPW